MNAIEIGARSVGQGKPTFVIAEAGSNHNGDISIAKELIDVAADANADAVKFQTFRAKDMYIEDSGEAEYLDDDRSIYEIIKEMEMPYEWIPELYEYCRDRDVFFMSTPFDERSADELEEYVPAFKIASYTMSHHPFLEHVAEKSKPIIMSTGAHQLSEIRESINLFEDLGFDDLVLLQCIAAYPTPLESINVRVVETFREEFDVVLGLSDHTLNPVTAPSAAVALGASLIEKHFTLDKTMEGPDHQYALEPDELREMVDAIRKTESVLGDGSKEVLEVEEELHDIARRRIHATRDIEAGEQITEENVAILRSGKRHGGLQPKYIDEILGSTVCENIDEGDGITWEEIEK